MMAIEGIKVMANTEEVLATLRKNREAHAAVVAEARVGYLDAVRALLVKRLDELNNGTLKVLSCALASPVDHTGVYDAAIKMLEMHTGLTIELDSDAVRNLIMDEWNWKSSWVQTNTAYSATLQNGG